MATLPTKQDADSLEQMVDRVGLTEVLNMLAAICADKADHIRSNWQDIPAARVWDQQGADISEAADKVNSLVCG